MKNIIQNELKDNSPFEKQYLEERLNRNYNYTYSKTVADNKGLRFLALANFNDARILTISVENMGWGKNLTLLINLVGAGIKTEYRKSYIKFIDIKNTNMPEKTTDLYIIEFSMQENPNLQATLKIVYYNGYEPHQEIWQINFSKVEVSPTKHLKH